MSWIRLLLVAAVMAVAAQSNGAEPPPLPRIRLERVVKVDKPVYVAHDPGGRLFVVEQEGRVLLLEGDKVAKTSYLDLRGATYVDFEGGLLSIAFHPRFTENGFVYAFYCTRVPDPAFPVRRTEEGRIDERSMVMKVQTRISEFHVDPKGNEVDPKTERIVLSLDKPYLNHNGGQIQFGPDGMLYVGTGDGGSADDPEDNAQNPKSLLGKMLRIDVTPRQAYAVPKDNPFVGRDGYAPEIWAIGLRNPWRFSFDRETGALYAGDVGQERFEEVNIVEKGNNYGWRVREGAHELHTVDKPPRMTDPIFEYPHAGRPASITGGYVYRGKKIPALRGWYLCADYVGGEFYGVKCEAGKVAASGMLTTPEDPARADGRWAGQPSGFGEDADGEIYVCDINGWVYRIVAGGK